MERCASCGKGSASLKACTACKLVKYCDVACQRAHRPEHKRECRRRAAELREEALFADPPPREECPICFLTMPLDDFHKEYKPCCGKVICMGCQVAANDEKTLKFWACPFCRSDQIWGDAALKKIKTRADNGDVEAMCKIGGYILDGKHGFTQDTKRAFEYFLRAGWQGKSKGYGRLGVAYLSGNGVGKDLKKARHYMELAAMGGDTIARHNIGLIEMAAGNFRLAVKHFLISAGSGDDDSLNEIQQLYSRQMVKKDVFEKALRSHQNATDKMKSDNRDKVPERLEWLVSEGIMEKRDAKWAKWVYPSGAAGAKGT